MAAIDRHIYEDRTQLAEALALVVGGLLVGSIATRGSAVLAVSGGSTPKQFFKVLSEVDLDWSLVTILLVDERIVPPTHDRANAKLVRENLIVKKAANAKLIAYEVAGETRDECAAQSAAIFADSLQHIDALVLGMGTDGHTASFFPGGDQLDEALNVSGDLQVISMRAEGAGEPRLTMTLPVVLNARFLALHIEGQEKMDVFETALAGDNVNEMPVRAVLQNENTSVNVFWAP